MRLRRFLSVMLRMEMMPVGRMGVVRGLFMAAAAVVFRRLTVMAGSVVVVFSGFVVMFSGFVAGGGLLAHRFCIGG
jgi:hypothetical protein